MPKQPDLTVEQFVDLLQGEGRLLGLDLGTKTIGLAICDSNWFVTSPMTTIRRVKFTPDVEQLVSHAKKEQVRGFVMGLPLNMNDSEGPRAQATRAFVRNMARFTDLPVLFWDERLSSFEAEEAMREAGLNQKKKAEQIDMFAAKLILESCLTKLCQVREARLDELQR